MYNSINQAVCWFWFIFMFTQRSNVIDEDYFGAINTAEKSSYFKRTDASQKKTLVIWFRSKYVNNTPNFGLILASDIRSWIFSIGFICFEINYHRTPHYFEMQNLQHPRYVYKRAYFFKSDKQPVSISADETFSWEFRSLLHALKFFALTIGFIHLLRVHVYFAF